MAFVFRSDLKSSFDPPNDNHLGPGQYLPLFDKKKMNKNKIPFLTSSPRKTERVVLDVPGPGSYGLNIIEEKKNFHNQKDSEKVNLNSTAIYRALEGSQILGEIDPVHIWVNNQQEKLGFMTKIKRFKDNSLEDIPGPGAYIKSRPNSDKTNKFTKLKKKDIKKPLYENLNPSKVESIPAKKHTYGFELDLNGSLIRNNDPESSIKFKGEKNDSVGPGNYNTVKPEEWYKKGTSVWSKSKIKKFHFTKSNFKNYFTTNNIINSKTSSTFYKSKEKSFMITGPENNSDAEIDIFISNKNKRSNSFDTNDNNNTKKLEVDMKVLKAKTKKMREVLFMNHTNKLFDRSYLLKSRGIDINPGPGYYFDEDSYAGFKGKQLSEEKQVFGSNCQRFPKIETKTDLGPAYYHQESNCIEQLKRKEIKEKLLIPQMAKIKKYKPVKVEEQEIPGPGYYNTENFFEIKRRVNTADNNFGSFEPRFKKLIDIKKINTPGPGTYTGQVDWGLRLNNNFAKIFNKPMTSNVNIRNSTFYNDSGIKKISKSKYPDSYFEKKSKDIIPPIGTYNPDQILNMEYKIAKNCAKNTLSEAPFNITKTKPRFDINNKNRSLSSNLGPGYYYKESLKAPKQIKNPFNYGDLRFKDTEPKYITNPGQYNANQYYDWNKKTFNILYV